MKKNTTKKQTRSSTKQSAEPSPSTSKELTLLPDPVAVCGRYPDLIQTRSGFNALRKAGFGHEEISASTIACVEVPAARDTHQRQNEREDLLGVTARMTGSMLGLATMPWMAPVLIAGPVVARIGLRVSEMFNGSEWREGAANDAGNGVLLTVHCDSGDAVERAAKALERTGAQSLALSSRQGFGGFDLKRREYRDESGQIHHHTHSYLRDHAE